MAARTVKLSKFVSRSTGNNAIMEIFSIYRGLTNNSKFIRKQHDHGREDRQRGANSSVDYHLLMKSVIKGIEARFVQ